MNAIVLLLFLTCMTNKKGGPKAAFKFYYIGIGGIGSKTVKNAPELTALPR